MYIYLKKEAMYMKKVIVIIGGVIAILIGFFTVSVCVAAYVLGQDEMNSYYTYWHEQER